jgi:FKBP-type peptidyl-prolyl cis-trans isomerase FklB
MRSLIAGIVGAGLCAVAWAATDAPLDLSTEGAKINYSLGYQIGQDFKRQNVELDGDAVVKGIRDALTGAQPLMKPQEMHSTLIELKRKIIAAQQAKRKEAEQKRLAEGKKFMEKNAKKEGVVTTASGLQYQVLKEGTGKSPSPSDLVTVNYRGTLIDGKEFDSSYKRGKPATFRLNGVIKGWQEGLQLMKEGGQAELVIPPSLAYGERGPLADQTLIFEVELISVGSNAKASLPAGHPVVAGAKAGGAKAEKSAEDRSKEEAARKSAE